MTAPSNANTGLEVVAKLADHLRAFEHHKVGSLRIDMNEVRNVIAACDFAASAEARIAELEEARGLLKRWRSDLPTEALEDITDAFLARNGKGEG